MAVHYFPVSQDINADLEVWELTDSFGVTGIRAWLEVLSIADRNNGVLPGLWSEYPRLLAARCQSTTKHLVGVCQFITRWLTVDSQGTARVTKYAKYHKIRAERSTAPNPPNPPNQLEDKDKRGQQLQIAPPNGVADALVLPGLPPATGKKKKVKTESPEFTETYKAYPIHNDRADALKAWNEIPPDELPTPLTVLNAILKQRRWRENAQPGEFRPHWKNFATWLRKRCWNDVCDELAENKPASGPEITEWKGDSVKLRNGVTMTRREYEYRYKVPVADPPGS